MNRKKTLIFKRAWDNICLSIILLRRKRKQNNQKQLSKKNRPLTLLHHYNYTFISEYQFSFSPSSTPNFHHLHRLFKKKTNRILSFLLCGSSSTDADRITEDENGMLGNAMLLYGETAAGDDRSRRAHSEVLPIDASEDEFKVQGFDETELSDEDDESVDGRADRFIEKFHEEMRIQRQESIKLYRDMLIKS
ncbi:uncharacterized protein LOC110026270 [Phalaenopsis equestris]|uniref:uncharacterized protein LOC110026270 n=1 Tax=Phalaenopsis equestris TaxID=78828 RepID=UPI0009E1F89F|nr:uncharacterized protein LOC110026270 [Phalaenopsis equestris]